MPQPTLKILTAALLLLPLSTRAFSANQAGATLQVTSGSNTSLWADGLIPLAYNDEALAFADIQMQGSTTSSGIVSAGIGYRQKIGDYGIIGDNLFFDRERSSDKSYYDVLGYGLEYLSRSWNWRFNYYLPVGDKTHLVQEGWANDMGDSSFISFAGHEEYDTWVQEYQSISYGSDMTLGYRFQNNEHWGINFEPFIFTRKENSRLVGANIRVNYFEGEHYKMFIGDGYDNATHNRVFAGIELNLGGRNNDNTLENLMISPVYRNQAVSTTTDGLPVSDYNTYGQDSELSDDNIYFIENTSSDALSSGTEDGTYENPYSSIDDVNDTTNTSAEFRVADTGNTYDSSETITLTGAQTIGGYTSDYTQLATGSDRPTIEVPGFTLEGTNTVQNLQIIGDGVGTTGITIVSGASGTVDEVTLGTSDAASGFEKGVDIESGAQGTITDSTITAVSSSTSNAAIGIESEGTLKVDNSTINSSSETETAIGINNQAGTATISNDTINATSSTSYGAYGINNVNSSIATISDSVINATGNGVTSYGVVNETGATATISGGTINSTSTTGTSIGLNNSGKMTVNNTTINSSSDSGTAYGLLNETGGVATLSNDTINASGTTANTFGIYNQASGTVTTNNSTVSATSTTGAAYGIDNYGTANINDGKTTSTSTAGGTSVGVLTNTGSILTMDSNTVTASSTGSGTVYGIDNYSTNATITGGSITSSSSGDGTVYGLTNQLGAIINVQDTGISATSTSGTAYGVDNMGTATIDGSVINATGYTDTFGIYNQAGSQLTLTDSIINSSSTNGAAYGIYNINGLATINNNTINVNASNGAAVGIHDQGTGTISNNTINATAQNDSYGIYTYGTSTISGNTITSSSTDGDAYTIEEN
jgi:hypothetical protein